MSVVPLRDLRPAFGEARDQGSRPTCCAFACSDLHAAARSPWSALSCEYAYYHGVQRQGTGNNGGVSLQSMLDVLQYDGQPHEAAWLYSLKPTVDLANWHPPSDVGEIFRAECADAEPCDISEVCTSIDAGKPVVLIQTISSAFYSTPDADGVIDSSEAIDRTRVHAVVAVAHGLRDGQKLVLVRNSWGRYWGINGYAWLSERYLSPRLIESSTLTKAI